MARVKRGQTTRARHKRVLAKTQGYQGTRSRLFKVAREALTHAKEYAYAGRRLRKRAMRKEWITALNAALSTHSLKYSSFISKLKTAHVSINRKMLVDLAKNKPEQFKALIDKTNPAVPKQI